MTYSLDFPRRYPALSGTGELRRHPEDFVVDEELGFELSGSGEHVYLHVQKQGENTAWIAKQLARLAGVRPMDVAYAGLKDRHAITRQWFSVWLPGAQEADWSALNSATVQVLQVTRHNRKLKKGIHRGNRFCLLLRQLSPGPELDERLQTVSEQGVPNYYGEQRFGIGAGNLTQADALLSGAIRVKDRLKRGLYLSAARSYLFNLLVAERVRRGILDQYIAGDRLMIAGGTELVREGEPLAWQKALDQCALHTTAPLPGRGRALVEAESLALEEAVWAPFSAWIQGLERLDLVRERRAARLLPVDMRWQWLDEGLQLEFSLPPGAFATSIVRELCVYRDVQREAALSNAVPDPIDAPKEA